jgi:copper chaperone CopZ
MYSFFSLGNSSSSTNKRSKGESKMGEGCGCSCSGGKKELTKVSWSVPDIKCAGGAGKLEASLKEVAGVVCASVKTEEKTVAVSFDAAKATEAELREIVGKAGYAIA